MGVWIFRIAFVAVIVGVLGVEAWDRFMPFDRPALTGAPCPAAPWSRVRDLRFEHFSSVGSRDRPRGVQVRTDISRPGRQRCRQIASRIDCTVTGPTTLRVIAGSRVEHFDIEAGRTAVVRAHTRDEGVACRMAGS